MAAPSPAYARDELGFKTEMTYILLASDISGKWDWGGGGRDQASVSDDLRELLALTPSFRLHDRPRLQRHGDALCGEPLRARPPAADRRSRRAQLKLYRGGHMFYLDPESRKAFSADAKAFYQSTQ